MLSLALGVAEKMFQSPQKVSWPAYEFMVFVPFEEVFKYFA